VFHGVRDSIYSFSVDAPFDIFCNIYDSLAGEPCTTSNFGGLTNSESFLFRPDREGYYYIALSSYEPITDSNYKLYYRSLSAPSDPYISLVSPARDAEIIGGERVVIFWTSGGSPYLNLFSVSYSLHGEDGPWTTISDSIVGTFAFWEVPVLEGDIHTCLIKVTSLQYPHVEVSSEYLSIIDPAHVYEQISPEKISFSAYPNPFNSSINIDIPAGFNMMRIFYINGKSVVEENLTDRSEGQFIWNPSDETVSGLYILELSSQDQRISKNIFFIK